MRRENVSRGPCAVSIGVVLAGIAMSVPVYAAPTTLYTSGNKVLANGQSVTLRGVNISALENTNTGGSSDSNNESPYLIDYVNKAINTFHANIIRLPICQDRWEGQAPVDPWGASNNASVYQSIVDAVVNQCSNAGVYVIIDDHWSDMGSWGQNLSQHNFCDWNTNQAWSDIATHYANNPAVIFGLYNEPHDVDWGTWQNGGTVSGETYNGGNYSYGTPGYQTLINTIRNTGAKNLVVAGGLNWAYDLTGLQNGYALSDSSGNGIMYDVHLYYFGANDPDGKSTQADWNSAILPAAQTYPVFAGEFGVYSLTSNQPGADWINNTVLPWVNQNLVGGTAWTCDEGDPTDPYGAAGFLLDTNDNPTAFGYAVQSWCQSTPAPSGGGGGGTPAFNATVSLSPSTVAPGGSVTATVTVNCTSGSLSNGIVDMELDTTSGTQLSQNAPSGQNFSSGQSQTYTWTFTAPSSTGTYNLGVGVFSSGWGTDYSWQDPATLTVANSTTPTPHSGTWMAQVSPAGNWNNLAQTVNVNQNTNYTVSFWNLGTGSIHLRVLTTDWGTQFAANDFTPASSSNWGQQSLTFNSGSNSQVLIDFTDSSSGGTQYIDDVVCAASDNNNVVSDGDFEQGTGQSAWYVQSPFSIAQN